VHQIGDRMLKRFRAIYSDLKAYWDDPVMMDHEYPMAMCTFHHSLLVLSAREIFEEFYSSPSQATAYAKSSTKGVLMSSKALCKNRYYKDLIKKRQVCFGMTRSMVESAWGPPWRWYQDVDTNILTLEWGHRPHSRVRFDADGNANEIFSVVHNTSSTPWKR